MIIHLYTALYIILERMIICICVTSSCYSSWSSFALYLWDSEQCWKEFCLPFPQTVVLIRYLRICFVLWWDLCIYFFFVLNSQIAHMQCTVLGLGPHLFHDLIGSRSIQLHSFMLAGQGKAVKTTSDHDLDNLIWASCIKYGFSLIFPVNFSSHAETCLLCLSSGGFRVKMNIYWKCKCGLQSWHMTQNNTFKCKHFNSIMYGK